VRSVIIACLLFIAAPASAVELNVWAAIPTIEADKGKEYRREKRLGRRFADMQIDFGDLTPDSLELLDLGVDMEVVDGLFKKPTFGVGGNPEVEWTLVSLYMDSSIIEAARGRIQRLFPFRMLLLGTWVVDSGICLRKPPNRTKRFMPDDVAEDGTRTPNNTLRDVNLRAGQAPRRFDDECDQPLSE